MKNRWIMPGIILFALGISLLWAAQGKAEESGQAIELTVWNQPLSSRQNEYDIWMETVSEFEKDYFARTKIRVRVKPIAREYIQQQFVTVMAGGKGPDVVHVWVGALATLARQGFLAPMTGEVDAWPVKSFIPPVLFEPATQDGKVYAVPYDSYFQTLLIRKDMFRAAGLDPQKPPATWAELEEDAVRLTKPDKNQFGFGFSPRLDYFIDFLWQAGGDMARKEGANWRLCFQENPGVSALTFLRNLRFKRKVMQPNPLANTEELSQLFALGRLAMLPGVANQMPALISRYGMKAEDLGIVPLPAGPGGVRASHAGGDYFIINAQSTPEKRRAAWAYIEYVLSPINQLIKYRKMKEYKMEIFPGAFSVATELVNEPSFQMVKETLAYVRTEPHLENWPLIKDQFETTVLQKAFTQADLDVADLLVESAKTEQDDFLSGY